MLTKYLFSVINEDYSNYTSADKNTIKRNRLFGLLMHIPTILWFVLGYFLSQQIFQNVSTLMSVITGLICSFFIYLLDLSIISEKIVSFKKIIFRFLIACFISVLGAMLTDVFFFEKDINRHLIQSEEENIDYKFGLKIHEQQQKVDKARSDWIAAEKEASCEASGQCGTQVTEKEQLQIYLTEKDKIKTRFSNKIEAINNQYQLDTSKCGLFCSQSEIDKKYKDQREIIKLEEDKEIHLLNRKFDSLKKSGSGKSGTGNIYKALKKHAQELKVIFEKHQTELELLKLENNNLINQLDSNIKNNVGIIEKVKILKEIIFSDITSIIFSVFFFAMFFILEIILLFTKCSASKTLNDFWEEHQEKVAEARIRIAEKKLKDYEEASLEGYQGPMLS